MGPTMDQAAYEKLMNDIFPGLMMFVRDANLPPVCAGPYQPGMIIKERGMTDATVRVMGMLTTHRFAILSNHMASLAAFENGTNWGLCVAMPGAHFKVMDVYQCRGKTQILLLHLPDDERWKVFQHAAFSIEEQLIASCRHRFEAKAFLAPAPEVAAQAWLDRCAAPLGMDEAGRLFELD